MMFQYRIRFEAEPKEMMFELRQRKPVSVRDVIRVMNANFTLDSRILDAGSPPGDCKNIWEIWEFFRPKYGRNMGGFDIFRRKIWEIWEVYPGQKNSDRVYMGQKANTI